MVLFFDRQIGWGILATILLFFFSLRGVDIAFSAYFHVVLPDRMRATFDSLLSGLNRLFLFVFLPLLGWLINDFGIIFFLMFIFILFSLVTMIVFIIRLYYRI
jgi:hypothetical protein